MKFAIYAAGGPSRLHANLPRDCNYSPKVHGHHHGAMFPTGIEDDNRVRRSSKIASALISSADSWLQLEQKMTDPAYLPANLPACLPTWASGRAGGRAGGRTGGRTGMASFIYIPTNPLCTTSILYPPIRGVLQHISGLAPIRGVFQTINTGHEPQHITGLVPPSNPNHQSDILFAYCASTCLFM